MFTVDAGYKIQQPLAQFFVAQLINTEWAQPAGGEHQVYSAKSDVDDGAGRELVTAYALKRPDGEWSLLVVNRDQENAHHVRMHFAATGGSVIGLAGRGRGRNIRQRAIQVESPRSGSSRTQKQPLPDRCDVHERHGRS